MNVHLEINDLCISCDNCRLVCPDEAILKIKNSYIIETWSCTLCSLCLHVCPIDCIKEIKKE